MNGSLSERNSIYTDLYRTGNHSINPSNTLRVEVQNFPVCRVCLTERQMATALHPLSGVSRIRTSASMGLFKDQQLAVEVGKKQTLPPKPKSLYKVISAVYCLWISDKTKASIRWGGGGWGSPYSNTPGKFWALQKHRNNAPLTKIAKLCKITRLVLFTWLSWQTAERAGR